MYKVKKNWCNFIFIIILFISFSFLFRFIICSEVLEYSKKLELCIELCGMFFTSFALLLTYNSLKNEKDQKHSLGYLVDYAPEFRLPHRYSLFVPFCYRLSLRDFDVVQKIKEDPQFQMYVEKALLLEMKKLLKEVSEEQALQIPLDIASSLENFLEQSQSILRMYLKR